VSSGINSEKREKEPFNPAAAVTFTSTGAITAATRAQVFTMVFTGSPVI